MYKLPIAEVATLSLVGDPVKRLQDFKNILIEEIQEIDEIIDATATHVDVNHLTPIDQCESELNVLTRLADLLGDIQVYCASEMAKFGIPLDDVLRTIMASNFSKQGVDGLPIYDERGKVLKGPNYWKPEPAIKALLEAKIL